MIHIAPLLRMTAPPTEDFGLLYHTGDFVPEDGSAGYAPGCLCSSPSGVHINFGTSESSSFRRPAAEISDSVPSQVAAPGTPVVFDGEPASAEKPDVVGVTSSPGRCISTGSITLGDWSEVSGNELLEPGKIYYLGEFGGITAIPPNSNVLVELGIAQTQNKLIVHIKTPIYF